MKKRNLFIFVCVLTSLIGVIGYTYSKWSVGFAQNEVNVLNVSCFETTLTENSYINLENTYPMKDSDGLNTTPLSFTLTNNCKLDQNIQINLEILNGANNFAPSQIKYSLDDLPPQFLNTLTETTKTLDNASISFNLHNDVIQKDTTHTYNLKMWVDENETVESASNKNLETKITVITSYGK